MNDNRLGILTPEAQLPLPSTVRSHHQQHTPFVLSSSQDMHHHLPPLHHSHPHTHPAHSHSLPKGLDTQAVNLMARPDYDPLPPQNQAQQDFDAFFEFSRLRKQWKLKCLNADAVSRPIPSSPSPCLTIGYTRRPYRLYTGPSSSLAGPHPKVRRQAGFRACN